MPPENTPPPTKAETALVVPSVTESLVRGEIHQQVMLARQFPRSVSDVIKKTQDLATITPEVAEECTYNLVQGGEPITGPSIRFAEIISSQWGNLRIATRTIDIAEKRVSVQGICHDMETGTVQMVEEVRGIWSTRHNRRYSEDMINKTLKAGHAIARRNAILTVIPRALYLPIIEKTRVIAAGNEASLGERRERALEFIEKAGVSRDRVFASFGVAGVEDLSSKDVTFLRGVVAAVREGETDYETQFPKISKTPKRKPAAATQPAADSPPSGATAPATEQPAASGQTPAPASASEAPTPTTASPVPSPEAAAKGAGSPAASEQAEAADSPPAEQSLSAQPAGAEPTPAISDAQAQPSEQGTLLGADPDALIDRRQRGRLQIEASRRGLSLPAVLKDAFGVAQPKLLLAKHYDAAMKLVTGS